MKNSVSIIGTRGYPSYYGGFETAVRKLAPYLVERGWDVTVYGRAAAISADDPVEDHRIKSVVTPGLETKSLSTLSHGMSATLHAAVKRPDVALVMNVANGYFLPLLKARGIPTLVNVDGIEWDRAKWGRAAKALFHEGARWTAKYGTRMVYDSRELANRWKTEFSLDGEYIPYGGEVPDALPISLGLQHRKYVLVVARFVPENTVPEFLEAAARICDNWPVVIVGSSGYEGPLDDQVRALAERSTNVQWLGHVRDDNLLLSLWQHAGVYFHGHSVGGTNPALVQAMAAGAPIVARNTVYNREVLGDEAIFCEPESRSIEAEILKTIGDPSLMDQSARTNQIRASKAYSWDSVCAKYENVLNDLASRKDK